MLILLGTALLVGTAAISVWFVGRHRRKPWKIVSWIAGGVLASASALFALLFLFGGLMCGRYDFPPVPSADGRRVARVSEEDCGALDSFHSSVQLQERDRGFFHPFKGKPTTVFTVSHDPRLLQVEWTGPRALAIKYPGDFLNPEEFSCQSKAGDVQITCIVYTPESGKRVGSMPPVKRWLFW
jgi:hypothetical protein